MFVAALHCSSDWQKRREFDIETIIEIWHLTFVQKVARSNKEIGMWCLQNCVSYHYIWSCWKLLIALHRNFHLLDHLAKEDDSLVLYPLEWLSLTKFWDIEDRFHLIKFQNRLYNVKVLCDINIKLVRYSL